MPDATVVVVTVDLEVFGVFTVVGEAELVGDFTVDEGALFVVGAAARGIVSPGVVVVGNDSAGRRGTFEAFRSPVPIWPHVFNPQHSRDAVATAQVCF